VPDASELSEPLRNAIRDQLIPALVGQEVSDAERQILALPLRHGGATSDRSLGNCQNKI